MKNLVCIVAGEPNSINSELIGKIWIKKKLFKKSKICRQNFCPNGTLPLSRGGTT